MTSSRPPEPPYCSPGCRRRHGPQPPRGVLSLVEGARNRGGWPSRGGCQRPRRSSDYRKRAAARVPWQVMHVRPRAKECPVMAVKVYLGGAPGGRSEMTYEEATRSASPLAAFCSFSVSARERRRIWRCSRRTRGCGWKSCWSRRPARGDPSGVQRVKASARIHPCRRLRARPVSSRQARRAGSPGWLGPGGRRPGDRPSWRPGCRPAWACV
jgi:hypothetical protein